MADSFDVRLDTEISINVEGLQERLSGEALRVFEEEGVAMVRAAQKQWTGWKYKGRDRKSVGRSRAGWGYYLQATENPRTVVIFNNARGYYSGEGYAGYVARSKSAVKEWRVVLDLLVSKHLPRLRDKLIAAVLNSVRSPGRYVKVRENRNSTYKTLSTER
jgi:hypothetical protein